MKELEKIALVKSHIDIADHLKRMKKNEEDKKKPDW
jgi:hypothetical protein